MRKNILLFLFAIGVSVSVHAFDYESVADTLSVIAQTKARMGNVRVTNIRVKGSSVWVYTNQTLSQASFSMSDVNEMRRVVSDLVLGHPRGKVTIMTGGYEIGELVTSLYRNRSKKDHYVLPQVTPWVTNTSLPYSITKGLSGKHLALWGSHGRYYLQSQETWRWQRAKLWTTVEDVYTTSYTMPFLVPMLENAGAIVVQPRERDTQTAEEVIDDSQAIAQGQWTQGETNSGWAQPQGPLTEEQNPFRFGTYQYTNSSTNTQATLRYVPSFEGESNSDQYAVYVSYKTLPQSTDKAQYTVMHRGQKTCFSINQQIGGGTWVYLGTFAFSASDPEHNYIEISNHGNGKSVITADAVKVGGGMGSVARYQQPDLIVGTSYSQDWKLDEKPQIDSAVLLDNMSRATTSGFPRWLEGSRYWLQYAGIPDSIYSFTQHKNDYTDDYSSRGRWVNYLCGGSAANPKQPGLGVPLCFSLAFHTDAGVILRDRMIGTLQIYTDHDNDGNKTFPTGASRQLNRDLSDYIQTQVVNDMRSSYMPTWTRRQLQNASYAESRYPVVPGTLIELLSHQNQTDMVYGLDPRVRFTISRAIYKGILRFMAQQTNTPFIVQPLPVQDMRVQRSGDDLIVKWSPTIDPIEQTAKPTYYVVYTRQDNGDWDNGTIIKNATQWLFTPKKGISYDFRVAAGNEGGVSMPSETLSAYIAPNEKGCVLIVNGFDRVSGPGWMYDSLHTGIDPWEPAVGYMREVGYIGDQFQFDPTVPWTSDDNSGWGECFSDHQTELTAGNTFDYPHVHGNVLRRIGWSYVSSSASALDTISDCTFVDWIAGKQHTYVLGSDTSFHVFTPKFQKVLTNYLQSGGRLLLSGSFIASDMRNAEDTAFVHTQLHYAYRNQHACHNGQIITERGLKPGQRYTFTMQTNPDILPTENPDGLIAVRGGQYIARYSDSGIGCCIGYDGSANGGQKTLCWGFMLESSRAFDTLYQQSIEWITK